jgi:hypothetical protein
MLKLSIFEKGHPPVFRLRAEAGPMPSADTVTIETVRPDGARQIFPMQSRGDYLQSLQDIPEPHAFTAVVRLGPESHSVVFEEHDHHVGAEHGTAHRDNNMRAALVHVMADAAVSVLVIVGLLLARAFGWLWMDPLAALVGAVVIASWSYRLIKDTGAILLDMCPDREVEQEIRRIVEAGGDRLNDLHVWRLGPGHLGAILSVTTRQARDPGYYQQRLARFRALSHVTVEVLRAA